MKKIKILFILFLLLLLSSCSSNECTKEYLSFGTYINITLNTNDEEVFKNVEKIINKLNKLTDKYNDYSNTKGVYYLNNHQGEEIIIDEDLYELIKLSIEKRILRDETNSYFEIGIGEITDLYKDIFDGYNKETIDYSIYPSDDLLNKTYTTNSSLIILNDEKKSIIVPSSMKLDLGGSAKGYLIDKLVEYFDSLNLKYLIDAGCSSITTNTINKNKGQYYTVGLVDPLDVSKTYTIINLKENFVLSTSGYYQKYFIYNNEIYSHIIDPLTAKSVVTDILSISIITNNGIDGDILSTSLYMMGSEKAIEYINSHVNIEGIIYTKDSIIKSYLIDEYIK